jgi:hypothetical protein
MDSYQHVNLGNQDQGQNQDPNQFGNLGGLTPGESAEEESSVKETIQSINRKNIIKTVIISVLTLIVFIIIGRLLCAVIQSLGDQGSTIGYTISSWFNGNISINPGNKRGFASFIKLSLTGLTIAGCLYAFNKFFSTKR